MLELHVVHFFFFFLAGETAVPSGFEEEAWLILTREAAASAKRFSNTSMPRIIATDPAGASSRQTRSDLPWLKLQKAGKRGTEQAGGRPDRGEKERDTKTRTTTLKSRLGQPTLTSHGLSFDC